MPRRRRRHPRAPSTPWRSLTRAQRKRRLIAVRNNIRRSSPYFRGLFHTSDALEPGRDWVDLVFLSRKRPGDYYNVTLQTALCEFREAVSDRAWDIIDPRLKGRGGAPEALAAMSEARERLVAQGSFFSRPRFELDFSYTAGIGLHATVDEPYLSPEAVERFVNAFLDGGEIAWQSERPLRWPAHQIADPGFPNPIGPSLDEDAWARELLARNKALDERLALEARLPSATGALGAPPRAL